MEYIFGNGGARKTMRICTSGLIGCLLIPLICLFDSGRCFGKSATGPTAGETRYLALPLAGGSTSKPLQRYGVPFLEGSLSLPANGNVRINVGLSVKHIFLLGMSEDAHIRAWADPRDHAVRFFIGDNLGQIRLEYDDGSEQIFPLVLGESVWWGKPFYESQDPFPTDAHLRKTFAASLRLYPAAPVQDGNYVAVITPRQHAVRSITIEKSPSKSGSVTIDGITLETIGNKDLPGLVPLSPDSWPADFKSFVQRKSLRPAGVEETQSRNRLDEFRRAFYTTDENFHRRVHPQAQPSFAGPQVSFKGDIFADILTNAFYANVKDMLAKIDPDGMYHTSTQGAVSWGGTGFGTFRPNVGMYYRQSWSRDMGRSLQELTSLGYLPQASSTADYALRMARLWVERPSLRLHGVALPAHWGRIANLPGAAAPFENDAQGLVAVFLYKLWFRLPNRDEWLRTRWSEIKAAGDWILWQFDHPDLSGSANGVLYTTGEAAGGKGYSVYADYSCMNALRALARMADSIGEHSSAALWRLRAEKMQQAIARQYIVTDPKYGRAWTLENAGWPNKSTVLGPLILAADLQGFAPEDGIPDWRPMDEAAYLRLIDTYPPFGFYGQAMGYGQGFVSQSALLLDRMQDATKMLDWAAKEIYDPRVGSFIVPEGVQIDPSGHYWYPAGDLGNGVQEAEIVKTLRIVMGVDDTEPGRLQLFPRMPYDWKEIDVRSYPFESAHAGTSVSALLSYRLARSGRAMKLEVSADKPVGIVAIRLGPFQKQPDTSDVQVNGRIPAKASIEHSGDSWWVRFTIPVGPAKRALRQ